MALAYTFVIGSNANQWLLIALPYTFVIGSHAHHLIMWHGPIKTVGGAIKLFNDYNTYH